MIEGPLDSHVYALAIGQGQLFAGLGDGTLLQSEDGGQSWRKLGERITGSLRSPSSENARPVKDPGLGRARPPQPNPLTMAAASRADCK